MDYREYIESHADIMLGKPVIKGTRISVELILRKLSKGASSDNIIAAYPHITPMAIAAVLAYASDIVANETMIAACSRRGGENEVILYNAVRR